MDKRVAVIGAGLAGSEAALSLAARGISVDLYEMRPVTGTPVHHGDGCAELVCSNSLKSTKPASAAGMLKTELAMLGSTVMEAALENRVAAGGALAVDRERFSAAVTARIDADPLIELHRHPIDTLAEAAEGVDALIVATGPLTSDALSDDLRTLTGSESLAFYDAAAPIVMADSLDMDLLFRQSRYEEGEGDYLNAAFSREEYERFIDELVHAQRVIPRDFETKDLFQACQPIEEIARKGTDAPRFGTLKPVGLTDPRTGKRPWAALQLRAEDAHGQSYNLVGFQTNLTFPEQKRVFSMIPGLKHAEFARYGVMHRNTFLDAPRLIDPFGRVASLSEKPGITTYVAGQLGGTEGYAEAIRSGLHVALALAAELGERDRVPLPVETAFGALMAYASDPDVKDYQPMHVNFGIMAPLQPPIRNKGERYLAYARRGEEALMRYADALVQAEVQSADRLEKGERDAREFLPR